MATSVDHRTHEVVSDSEGIHVAITCRAEFFTEHTMFV